MRVLAAGATALLVELDDPADVPAWHGELSRRRRAGELDVVDLVPGGRTVLLDGLVDLPAAARLLDRLTPPAVDQQDLATVEIPVRYDGADLAEVADRWRMSTDDVVRTHTDTRFRVAFCGFAPGFAYLTGLPPELHVARRADPRTSVPAGSVALAGEYTGVYPTASPGGWQLIGRTDAVLFDIDRDPPALLTPGTPVRFVAEP